jgi:hypothetical protein
MRQPLFGRPLFTARLYVLDPRLTLFANLVSHGTASQRERPRSRRKLGPQKLAWYWRKTEGTFDCQASLVVGRQRTAQGGKGTDVRPAGRVHPGEAASKQKQGEIDGSLLLALGSAINDCCSPRPPLAGRGPRRSPGWVTMRESSGAYRQPPSS